MSTFFVTVWLREILQWIYGLVNNYGIAVIIFTVLIRTVLTPFEVKSRKGMRKMSEMQPKLNKLQQKYGDDKERLQQKQAELMKKEHYNPMSGCLPLLLQWPILFCMFYAMRDIANMKLVEQAFTFLKGETPVYESFLWIKNVFMADSPFKTIAPDANAMISIGYKAWKHMLETVSEADLAVMLQHIQTAVPAAAELTASQIFDFSSTSALQTTVNTYLLPTMQQLPDYIAQTAAVSGWKNVSVLLFSFTLYKDYNGLLILPVLSGVTQWMMTKLNPAMQEQDAQQQQANQQNGSMNAFMKYFFPIFSAFICLSSNAGFALYWVTINLFATAQSILINKYLEKKDAAAKALTDGEESMKL